MRKRALTKSRRGAVATGAASAGAASLGAMAVGAFALGALAVGALAIGRLSIGRARLRRVEIGELTVGRLGVGSVVPGATLIASTRAAPGRGDALERLALDHGARRPSDVRLHRSLADPDLFLIELPASGAGRADLRAHSPWLDALLHRAEEDRLVETTPAGQARIEHCRTI